MKETKYLVAIRCMTYNQSSYINDALNGFVMQETSFPFVAVVVDDASTDGEQEVIFEYVNKHFNDSQESGFKEWETEEAFWTFAQHRENKNCHFVVAYLKKNLYGNPKKLELIKEWCNTKYIAVCEGDDYWTDPLKLQKQVSFLEDHPDYSLCCHRFKMYYENDGKWADDFVGRVFAKHPEAIGLDVTNAQNFRTRFTCTLTLCYRKAVADAIAWPPYKFGHRDINFHYHLLKEGKGWCLPDFMGVYRKNAGGVWTRLSLVEGAKTRLECYEDLLLYNHSDNVIRDCYVYWLECFYREFVLPPFLRHKVTSAGMKNLWFYCKHCRKVRSPFIAFKKCVKCFCAFFSV